MSVISLPEPTPYYLTVSIGSRCDDCGKTIKRGDDLIYRYEPRTVLCPACANRMGVVPVVSKKYLKRSAEAQANRLAQLRWDERPTG